MANIVYTNVAMSYLRYTSLFSGRHISPLGPPVINWQRFFPLSSWSLSATLLTRSIVSPSRLATKTYKRDKGRFENMKQRRWRRQRTRRGWRCGSPARVARVCRTLGMAKLFSDVLTESSPSNSSKSQPSHGQAFFRSRLNHGGATPSLDLD